METMKFVYYQEGNMWVGWLEEYPDYRSQGKTLDELHQNIKEAVSVHYGDIDETVTILTLSEETLADAKTPSS